VVEAKCTRKGYRSLSDVFEDYPGKVCCCVAAGLTLSAQSSVPLSANSRAYLLCLGYDLTLRLLEARNIHTVAAERDAQGASPSDLVRTFNAAEAELLHSQWLERPHYATCLPSALLKGAETGAVGLFPVFGGQGVAWIRELSTLYQTYPVAQGLIRRSLDVLVSQSRSDEAKQVLGRGILIDSTWVTEGMSFFCRVSFFLPIFFFFEYIYIYIYMYVILWIYSGGSHC
jgi:hypothetical protein